jgi:putative tricarboxylic transport membrane protein
LISQFSRWVFGIGEILFNARNPEIKGEFIQTSTKLRHILPNIDDWRRSIGPILRGTGIGFFLGIIPGGGTILSTFASYALERKISDHPEEFGKGAIEGVAGPESANNAASSGAFVPLLTLGIPCTAIQALLLAAFMIHGIAPGPMIIKNRPDVFWGIVMSMYIGNVFLLILNVPCVGLFVRILKVPTMILYPVVLLICLIGAFSTNNNPFDVLLVGIVGIFGYVLRTLNFNPAPLVLAYVVGPILERTLRQSLMISDGDLMIFLTRPIARVMTIITVLFLVSPFLMSLIRRLIKRPV